MNNTEHIKVLYNHLMHWQRLLTEGICDRVEGEQTVAALTAGIKALEQESWNPLITRDLTESEKERYISIGRQEIADQGKIFDCHLPDDGQEVLITVGDYVMNDIFINDDFGCYFENADIDDVTAWMPMPESYKKEEKENE